MKISLPEIGESVEIDVVTFKVTHGHSDVVFYDGQLRGGVIAVRPDSRGRLRYQVGSDYFSELVKAARRSIRLQRAKYEAALDLVSAYEAE